MNSAPLRLTVVVCAFNEVENLADAVEELRVVLVSLAVPCELVIVDDGSTDGTGRLADEIAAAHPDQIRVVHHGENLGLGGAYRTGFAAARGEFLTFFPADSQFPASIIADFWPLTADHDLILGYLPLRRPSMAGRVLSLAERVAYRVLLGPMPRFQGVFMLRRRLLDELELRSAGRGWGVVMELVIRAARGPYRIVSNPTSVRPRAKGVSKVQNLRNVTSNLIQLWKLRAVL